MFANEGSSHGYWGSGKVALRSGLSRLDCSRDGSVLLPACLPAAVVEPILELGLEPEWYAVEPDLGADLADLEARIDDSVEALMVVHYFGFVQPHIEEILALADEHDLAVIGDNAHSPLSRHNGHLLGTLADVGFTSLHKLLPMPDGAVLFDGGSDGGAAGEPPQSGISQEDVTFPLSSLGLYVRARWRPMRRLGRILGSALRPTDDPNRGTSPTVSDDERANQRYTDASRRISRLSWYLTGTIDPVTVTGRRRANYRTWLDVLSRVDELDPLYGSLEPGVCPQVMPATVEEASTARRFVSSLADWGILGVHQWPTLRTAVANDSDFRTANDLANRLVVLPCHQSLSPATIERLEGSVATAVARPV